MLGRFFAGFAAVILAGSVLAPVAAAFTGDLNCADFGTRERAQFEMDRHGRDVHGLDGDNDGKACEWNASTGWWGWPTGGAALVLGRHAARRKMADARVVPGVEGLWNNYMFHEDGNVDKVLDRTGAVLLAGGLVALPLIDIMRDRVFPRSFGAAAIVFLVAGAMAAVAFAATWTKENKA